EEVPAFAIIEVKKEPVVQQNNSTTFRFVLSGEDELSLLQENLYVEGSEVFVENSHFELFDGDVEQVLQIEELDVHQNYNFAQYSDMTQLIKDFYVIDASTSPDADLLDVDALNGYDCTIDKESAGPQILIYHSHSQEGFADSIPGDASTTIVGAGEKLTRLLEEEYGFDVLHHTGVYDYPSRDEAYSNALPAIEQVLEENPTIQVVIDLHRDAVAEGTKLVTTIDGKDYARFMFFNGICRSTKGPITYLNNPYLKENLAFSFQSQVIAESYFPGITRKIYLKAWRYNMHFKPRNMLIELGAQTNTVEEIMNTTEILAFVINEVLSRQ
ncbi:MAG: stage II sporulation protein P, partial [Lachnospiraceae bacterium]|nr:stage II sporulation protein P [Lachnospiraceae bacterium]